LGADARKQQSRRVPSLLPRLEDTVVVLVVAGGVARQLGL
jgi:hypothetical protein